jgi:hypothetical protein
MRIGYEHFIEFIDEISFGNYGDEREIEHGYKISKNFPNCEKFWRTFVAPMTQRIYVKIGKSTSEPIRRRKEVSDDLYEIAVFHYTVFTKLIFAHGHLEDFRPSSFEEFYMHLVSCCDVAEDFLLKTYILQNECYERKSNAFQELGKAEFLKMAEVWYDKHYHVIFEHYLSKGKFKYMSLPSRANILDEYFDNSTDWKDYKKLTSLLRQYRNVLVHSSVIGKKSKPDKPEIMVPKKEKIGNYKKLTDVIELYPNSKQNDEDFIEMKTQMTYDFMALQDALNKLWEKPITDLWTLLNIGNNHKLLSKYGIEFKQ